MGGGRRHRQATEKLQLGTGVTCPTVRTHPAIVAQAAATAACLMPGRFFLGVGTGEALNEHILGDRWPPVPVRLAMLEEAVQVIRLLWEGGSKNHDGNHYTVENGCRSSTTPASPTCTSSRWGRTKPASLASGKASSGPRSANEDSPDGGGPPGPRYDGRVPNQHHQGAHMGAFEEAKGKLKEAAGDLTDNAGLKREGQAQSEKGEAEREATEARTEAKAHEAEAAAREAEQRGAERLK